MNAVARFHGNRQTDRQALIQYIVPQVLLAGSVKKSENKKNSPKIVRSYCIRYRGWL